VVTRWYRAPEVILLETKKKSLCAIDMWSIGCIFTELLQMNERFCNDVNKRRCLFPGACCWPLSPNPEGCCPENNNQGDQLEVIFSKLGLPTAEDIEKIENSSVKAMLRNHKPVEPCAIQEIFPAFPSDVAKCKQLIDDDQSVRLAIDLMLQFLRYDVGKRVTAKKVLRHPYFQRVREPKLEVAHRPVIFDFETLSLDAEKLGDRIARVISNYNQQERQQ